MTMTRMKMNKNKKTATAQPATAALASNAKKTTTTMTMTTMPIEEVPSSSSEISITTTAVLPNTNTNQHHHHPQHHHQQYLMSLGMLLLGYWLGQQQQLQQSISSSLSLSLSSSNDVWTIPKLVDDILVPAFSALAMIYILARVTIWKGACLAPFQKDNEKKMTFSKQQGIAAATDRSMNLLKTNDTLLQQQQYDDSFNMTGSFQLIRNDNFEALLAVQGVPWALRVAANKLRPIHRFTHCQNNLTIKIEGIIESETSYIIGGPPIECEVRGRKFKDTMEYIRTDMEENQNNTKKKTDHPKTSSVVGIKTIKRAIEDGYTVTVARRLSNDQKVLTMTSTVQFESTSKQPVTAVQIFERMPEEEEEAASKEEMNGSNNDAASDDK